MGLLGVSTSPWKHSSESPWHGHQYTRFIAPQRQPQGAEGKSRQRKFGDCGFFERQHGESIAIAPEFVVLLGALTAGWHLCDFKTWIGVLGEGWIVYAFLFANGNQCEAAENNWQECFILRCPVCGNLHGNVMNGLGTLSAQECCLLF